MAERFEKLFSLPVNLYSIDSPILIVAGALLKDTETGRIVAQIKFHSVSSVPIKALKVSISAYDVEGKEIEGIDEYQYLDLNVNNGQDFGANKAIVFPNNTTRSFDLKNITVVLSNGTTHNVNLPLTALPVPETLQSVFKDNELVKQYQIATSNESAYIPCENQSLWCCSCGIWNNATTCTKCQVERNKIFDSLDVSTLTTIMDARLKLETEGQKNELN